MRVLLKELLQDDNTKRLRDWEKNFLIRVQLTNSGNYDDLHDVMLTAGFEREVVADSGKRKQLPDAMYFLPNESEDMTAQSVHAKVMGAVRKHKVNTAQPGIIAHVIVVAVSDIWFELEDADD